MDYWKTRSKNFDTKFSRAKAYLSRFIIGRYLLSLRLRDHAFIYGTVASTYQQRVIKLLDVGCGSGQDIASDPKCKCYGVDIKGFPREVALQKGYVEAAEYGEDGTIPFAPGFDVAIIVNVIAHVSDEIQIKMFRETKRLLKPDGLCIIVAEVDNDGFSYGLFKKISKRRFVDFVLGMDHTNLKPELEFEKNIHSAGLSIEKRETITGHMLPIMHYFSYFFSRSPYKQLRYLSLVVDMVLSVIDSILIFLFQSAMQGRRFRVGYLCKVSGNRKQNTCAE